MGYSDEATPPNIQAVIKAFEFINHLPKDLPIPELGFDNDGEVSIDWDYGNRRMFSVSVSASGALNYAGLIGKSVTGDQEWFRGTVSETIISHIKSVVANTPFHA